MGLDMYLEAVQYVSDFTEGGKPLIESIKNNSVNGLEDFHPTHITYELAYWRKANAIHGWFIKNVLSEKTGYDPVFVSLKKLEDLKEVCEKVLHDMDLAPELLPVTKGFFFGEYEYNEYYTFYVTKTLTALNKILSNPNARKWWITYRASW